MARTCWESNHPPWGLWTSAPPAESQQHVPHGVNHQRSPQTRPWSPDVFFQICCYNHEGCWFTAGILCLYILRQIRWERPVQCICCSNTWQLPADMFTPCCQTHDQVNLWHLLDTSGYYTTDGSTPCVFTFSAHAVARYSAHYNLLSQARSRLTSSKVKETCRWHMSGPPCVNTSLLPSAPVQRIQQQQQTCGESKDCLSPCACFSTTTVRWTSQERFKDDNRDPVR